MARIRRTKTKMNNGAGKIAHIKTTIDGITFDSKMESEYYKKLKADKEAGLITDFELQPSFVLQEKFIMVEGKVIYGDDPEFNKIKRKTKAPTISAIKYTADFKVYHLDGSIEIIDTKGKSTADFEIKRKMFMAKYGQPLSVIIQHKDEWVDFYENRKRINAAKRLKKKEGREGE